MGLLFDTEKYDWIVVPATAIFGACHLIGWNFEFPTPVESLLWRIASVCCVVVPLLFFSLVRTIPERYEDWFIFSLVPLYIIVRLYLIVEVFAGYEGCQQARTKQFNGLNSFLTFKHCTIDINQQTFFS